MEAYYNCLHCKNKRVRIMTTDGKRHEGVIVDVDQNNVYLKTKGNGKMKTSAFYPGAQGIIMGVLRLWQRNPYTQPVYFAGHCADLIRAQIKKWAPGKQERPLF